MSEKDVESFLDMISWRSKLLAPDIVKMIDLSHVRSILDIGGGQGEYTIEFVLHQPNARATIFTYPNIAPFTQENLVRRKISDKIDVVKGDFYKDDIGSGYDLIFCSFVMQYNSIWDNIDFAKKMYTALKPGGQIVIQDLLVKDDRTSPEFNALFSLELLVNSKAGDTYTSSELWIILKEAWFNEIETVETDFGTTLVFATKS
jgi:SAM-dependent methyltransferase